MSNWKQSFDSLTLPQRIDNAITKWESCKTDISDPAIENNLQRLLKVLHLIKNRILGIDPDLYTPNTWGNFSQLLDGISNYGHHFKTSKGTSYIQQANEHADQLLIVLRQTGLENRAESVEAVAAATAAFTQRIGEFIESIRAKSNTAAADLQSLKQTVDALKTRVDEAAQSIQQEKGRLDKALGEHQSQFSASQEKRATDFASGQKRNSDDFAKQQKGFETDYKATAEARTSEFAKFIADSRLKDAEHVGFLETRRDDVDKIFGVIGTTALAGNFKNTADEEGKAADQMRKIALGMMAAMIAVSVVAFIFSITHEPDWKIFLFRMGTVVILAVPAVYAANESSKHREREMLNRKLHLELASIDAYLEPVLNF